MDLQAQFDSFIKLQWEAFCAGQYRRTAETAQAAVKIAEALGDHGRRVHALFWVGVSLHEIGEIEAALSVLLEAANTNYPQVDPADTFSAQTRLILIAGQIKPRAYSASLIESSRRFLEQIGKESWDHKLDLLHGSLEFSRGEYILARDYQIRSWHRHATGYPTFTQATHLSDLCRTAFELRDSDDLKQYLDELGRCPAIGEPDEIEKVRSASLVVRADRTWQSDSEHALGLSRTLLRRAAALDSKENSCLAALRLLALCGAFEEVAVHWKRYAEKNKRPDFADRLCEADLALMETRSLARMPPIDDEWDTEFPPPQPPAPNGSECLTKLDRCETLYRNLFDLAAREDIRLETEHYSRTLQGRLDRVRTIRMAIEANP